MEKQSFFYVPHLQDSIFNLYKNKTLYICPRIDFLIKSHTKVRENHFSMLFTISQKRSFKQITNNIKIILKLTLIFVKNLYIILK